MRHSWRRWKQRTELNWESRRACTSTRGRFRRTSSFFFVNPFWHTSAPSARLAFNEVAESYILRPCLRSPLLPFLSFSMLFPPVTRRRCKSNHMRLRPKVVLFFLVSYTADNGLYEANFLSLSCLWVSLCVGSAPNPFPFFPSPLQQQQQQQERGDLEMANGRQRLIRIKKKIAERDRRKNVVFDLITARKSVFFPLTMNSISLHGDVPFFLIVPPWTWHIYFFFFICLLFSIFFCKRWLFSVHGGSRRYY